MLVLVVHLIYDPPGHRHDMMGIHEYKCVRRYKRLPQILVVDGGSDFNRIACEALLALHHVTQFERPAVSPRAGSAAERLFGTTKTGFIVHVRGKTQASKKPQEMTCSVDPRRKATWTSAAFYRRLCQWCYDVYDKHYVVSFLVRMATSPFVIPLIVPRKRASTLSFNQWFPQRPGCH